MLLWTAYSLTALVILLGLVLLWATLSEPDAGEFGASRPSDADVAAVRQECLRLATNQAPPNATVSMTTAPTFFLDTHWWGGEVRVETGGRVVIGSCEGPAVSELKLVLPDL